MFRTTFHNTVTTPLPPDVSVPSLTALLHDHSYLITMQPIVTRHAIRTRDPTSGKIVYDVWENLTLLPFNLWKKEIQFTAAFTDTKAGVVSTVEAPMGFVSTAEYTVRPSHTSHTSHDEGDGDRDVEGGDWVLEEQIESTCNVCLKWFVQGTMVPVRQKMHAQIMEKCAEREQRRSQASARDGQQPEGNWNNVYNTAIVASGDKDEQRSNTEAFGGGDEKVTAAGEECGQETTATSGEPPPADRAPAAQNVDVLDSAENEQGSQAPITTETATSAPPPTTAPSQPSQQAPTIPTPRNHPLIPTIGNFATAPQDFGIPFDSVTALRLEKQRCEAHIMTLQQLMRLWERDERKGRLGVLANELEGIVEGICGLPVGDGGEG